MQIDGLPMAVRQLIEAVAEFDAATELFHEITMRTIREKDRREQNILRREMQVVERRMQGAAIMVRVNYKAMKGIEDAEVHPAR